MTKKEIIEIVSRETHIDKSVCKKVFDASVDVIATELGNGEPIYIRGLFSLFPIKRATRVGQYINKKKAVRSIVLPEHYAPKAKFAKVITEKMAKLPLK